MSLKIRLAAPAPKAAVYHIVIADSRSPRDGFFIEQLGYFNRAAEDKTEQLKLDLEGQGLARQRVRCDRPRALPRRSRHQSF